MRSKVTFKRDWKSIKTHLPEEGEVIIMKLDRRVYTFIGFDPRGTGTIVARAIEGAKLHYYLHCADGYSEWDYRYEGDRAFSLGALLSSPWTKVQLQVLKFMLAIALAGLAGYSLEWSKWAAILLMSIATTIMVKITKK